MKVRPYRPGDYDHLRLRPQDSYGESAKAATRLMCEIGNTLVAEHDGIPIAIWGIVKLWKGVAHVWTAIGEDARGHGIVLTKTIEITLRDYCIANKIIRCEAYIKPEITENVKWAKLLGFEYECTHCHSSPTGGDLDIYARFYHGKF